MKQASARRILCVWLPYWAATRWRNARQRAQQTPGATQMPGASAAADEPLATVAAVRGMRRVVAVCPHAEAAGVHAGQALTQARAICPRLVVTDAEPGPDAAALAALAQWASRYTPLVAVCVSDGPVDALWLDIAGCAHLYGGEAALAQDLASRFARWGLVCHWAIAATSGAAWALAHHAAPPAIVPDGAEEPALAALPIASLRLEPGTLSGLRRLGLKTVAALAGLPRGELAARFGQCSLTRLDQAFGAVVEPIAWLQPPTGWAEQEAFAEPISTTEDCARATTLLAQRLCDRLAAKRLGGRQFVAAFQRVDGSWQHSAIATAQPVHNAAYLVRLLEEKLQGLDPGFGIEAVALHAHGVELAEEMQQAFDGNAGEAGQTRLAQLVDTLANRLRPGRLWRMAPRESHIPERAMQPVAPLAGKAAAVRWQDDAASPRPIRLLAHPEPIDVTAPLPDDPPMQFRWRGALHRVRAATGPERIGDEWWAKPSASRDYYHVEDEHGARYWMYRCAAQWFLHGLFG